MILMADDGVDISVGDELGFGMELENEDFSIDLDSLMSMLEDDDADRLPHQNALVDYITNDAQQGDSAAVVSCLPGISDQRNGPCSRITSPIHSCSGSLKDWIPLEPKYESLNGGVALNGTAVVPHSRNSNYERSGVSYENTSQNVALHIYDNSYIHDDQYQFWDSQPLDSSLFLPTQYNKNSNGSHFLDSSSPYFSDSFDFQSIERNEDATISGGDENNFYSLKTEFGDRLSDHSRVGRSEGEEDSEYFMPFSHRSFPDDDLLKQQTHFSTHPLMHQDKGVSDVFSAMQMDTNGCISVDEMIKDQSVDEMIKDQTRRGFYQNHDDRFSTNIDLKPQLQTAVNLPEKIAASENLAAGERAGMSHSGIDHSKDRKRQKSLVNTNGRGAQVTTGGKLSSLKKHLREKWEAMHHVSGQPKVLSKSFPSNSNSLKSQVGDDTDVCIIEEISKPPRPHPLTVTTRHVGLLQKIAPVPISFTGAVEMRPKVNDERLILRVAMQDFSQPRTEMDPPEGVLAVPLLRHQKIALSWMVNKETAGVTCSGGILADDQGLGKTISTIALILKERSPSSKPIRERSNRVTLNLDDDEIQEIDGLYPKDTSTQLKGRPSAGTLIVCPTSVLRQWADELCNKVTSEANLTVLVYHGSSRTKDPSELAKYDVVITTYSIVSMEVPKQPIVDQDEDDDSLEAKFSSFRKRKFSEGSDKKSGKKRTDKALLESAARPLAKVGWFRVVLDEAQSIKNHRTQVARACWGLRAKRRWCLSGTPIQNSIDDLYSYFRFLKYEPYAAYKSFCSSIKVPVQRNPAKGYKKLQAVLKTVLLRRTKGTILDGEPIINLPPKTIELRKVEFSTEERCFYLKLENDSRAQFAAYAAAGTVKQNYVNILLMLLRLRQACDHPYLVKKCAFSSVWRSSVDDAKKVPIDKRTSLVNCLEGGLALCGICNDVPEDAVVSVCGHVYCNQCISEHLTGDDNQCPKAACKVRLSASSVFSKETLVISMSDQSPQGTLVDSADVNLVEPNEPTDPSYCSSKLKAAVEVLKSLPKYNIVSEHYPVMSSKKHSSCQKSHLNHGDEDDIKHTLKDETVEEKDLHDAVKVVGEKAIVFSQWTRMLDLLESCLKKSSIVYRRLDGTMSVLARDKAVKDFNTMPEVTVMIMSLKAASLGLNMVSACHVLMLDLWWNPTTEDQAIDRAHRIGQTRPVKVLRLTIKETVEDRILALQQKKREMVSSAFGEDEKGGTQSRLTVEDLKYLFMA